MALNQTQVSQLYVTLFGRASEGSGNKYWQAQSDMAVAAQMMLDTAAAKTYFGTSMDDNQKFIEHIYKNTLNKTVAEDAAGIKFWVDALNAGNSRGFIASELLKAAVDPKNAGKAQNLFNNKVEISNYTANKVQNVKSASQTDLKPFVDALSKVTDDPASIAAGKAFVDTIPDVAMDTSSDWISTPVNPGETFTLTNGTDKATANVFNAPMVYTPDGSDRIKSLQDEDILTGTAGRKDNTLNVEMGQINNDEGDGGTRTPQLHNIQNVNIQFTGNSKEVDLRYADSVNKVNIDKITKLTLDTVSVTNIGQKLEGVRIANAAKETGKVTIDFKQGVLAGTEDSGLLVLHNVLADKVIQTSNEGTGDKEGYEKLNLTSKAGVKLNELSLNQLKELTIKGSGNLTIAKLTNPDTPDTGLDQFLKLEDGGLVANATTGLTKIDASGFNGKLTLDVSTVINPSTNPFVSGQVIPIEIIGGGADDIFYSKKTPSEKTKINGNGGNDKLVLIGANIDTKDLPSITNIENLELRIQGDAAAVNSAKADLDAFKDEALTGVLVRNENMNITTAAEFELKNIKKALAESGNIVIEHSVDAMINENDTVNKKTGVVDQVDLKLTAILKDAKGDKDALNLTVKNANNTQKVFNYDIVAAGVESITIDDQDTETNIVGLHKFADHKETITLKGGKAGQDYTIKDQLLSKVIDGSGQASNLRLQVGEGEYSKSTNKVITQDIKLGKGDDILTFNNLDDFDSNDKVSDAGGHDIVRAAFSKDSTLNISGIEELHTVATENVKLNMTKAEIEKLVIMSNKAVDQNLPGGKNDNSPVTPEPFGITSDVDITDIITIDGSKLNALNFFGDLDKDDKNGPTANPGFFYDDEDKTQNFNGVTLTDNKAEKLAININSSLDKVFRGAETYKIGQITAHGSKEINIVVKDEYYKLEGDTIAGNEVKPGKGAKDYSNTKTTINNIFANTMNTLTVEAQANVDLQVVSGAGTRDNIMKVDATKVGGNFFAHVKALGDGAVVDLGDASSDKAGDWAGNVFSGYSSKGNGITYKAGNGNNKITGNNKNDNITVGDGLNIILADQGNNKVVTGNGNDLVNALAGDDTIVLGRGNDIYVDNVDLSGADHFKDDLVHAGAPSGTDAGTASTSVTKTGDAGMVFIHAAGNNVLANAAVKQWMAVGVGSELQLEWEGNNFKTASATLDGSSALTLAKIGDTDANANLFIETAGAVKRDFDGKAGNDVYISAVANTAVDFSGGDGNDAVVGGDGSDLINGGKGADVAVLQHKVHTKIKVKPTLPADKLQATDYDGKADVVSIAMGDSTIDAWDKIYMFDSVTLSAAVPNAVVAGVAGGDTLKLKVAFNAAKFAGNEVTAGAQTLNGNDVGEIKGHSVDNKGFVSFKSLTDTENTSVAQSNYDTAKAHTVAAAGTEVKINASNLKDALAYLAKYYDGTGATVMFRYDGNNDGAYGHSIHDSVFVFQDGEIDTVVELVGVPDTTTGLNAGFANNNITIQQL